MQIEIRSRHVEVTEELRRHVEKRFARIGRQIPDSTLVHVELSEERNPSIADREVAEATLRVNGQTLHAREASPDMLHSIHALAEDVRRQVKRRSERLRKRARTRRLVNRFRDRTA